MGYSPWGHKRVDDLVTKQQMSLIRLNEVILEQLLFRKTIALTGWTLDCQVMPLLFNTLSRFVIAFLPRSNHFIILWPRSPSGVVLEPKKMKSVAVSTFPLSICHEVMGPDAMILVFLNHHSQLKSRVPDVTTSVCMIWLCFLTSHRLCSPYSWQTTLSHLLYYGQVFTPGIPADQNVPHLADSSLPSRSQVQCPLPTSHSKIDFLVIPSHSVLDFSFIAFTIGCHDGIYWNDK